MSGSVPPRTGRPPSETPVITVATVDDFDDWFRLYETVAAEGHWIAGEGPCDEQEQYRRFHARIDDLNAVTFLARAGGPLLGGLGMEIQGGVADFGMIVDAASRGFGIGSMLLTTGIDWAAAHGAHKVSLEVWPHNGPAIGLYKKQGFQEEGLLRRQYRRRNGELWDALRMGLILDHRSPGSPYGDVSPEARRTKTHVAQRTDVS